MPAIDHITTFLKSLTAVSPSHYQIWDTKGKMRFSTNQEKTDFMTMTSHLEMAKKVILAKSFLYTPVGNDQYLCGHPIGRTGSSQGALLAMGPVCERARKNGHPGQLKSLLRDITSLARNGSTNDCEATLTKQDPKENDFEDLFLFANISKQFRSLRFKQPVLGRLLHRMAKSFNADVAFLRLDAMPQYDTLEVSPDFNPGNTRPDDLKDKLEAFISASLDQCDSNYCIVNDSKREAGFESLSDQPFRFLAAAVRHMQKRYGWVGLVSYQMDLQFKPRDVDIVQTLANQFATMIGNMEQQDDLEKFTVNIVCSLVNAIEAKDAFVRGHSKRVHQYTMQMAKLLRLPKDQTEALRWASVLHDIGKIGIPERILCKPGTLTEKEFDLIKQHPMKGKSILEPIRQLAPSMGAIAYHHERYNGTGYPEGLKGEEIPLAARIIAVADTFDALTSARSYHESKSPDAALKVLDQVAGTQLDPHLVKVFRKAYQHIADQERLGKRPSDPKKSTPVRVQGEG